MNRYHEFAQRYMCKDVWNLITSYLDPKCLQVLDMSWDEMDEYIYNGNGYVRLIDLILWGNLNIIKRFCDQHGHLSQCYISNYFTPIDIAAEHGHFKVVKWLHLNGEECTYSAIDWAAEGGYLEIVKWLHKNRTEGYSSSAMIYAARNGHLDVLDWLLAKNGHSDFREHLYWYLKNEELKPAIREWLMKNKILTQETLDADANI